MIATPDCAGTWRPVATPGDNDDLHVYLCPGCGDWWIIIGPVFATTIIADLADTVEATVRLAVTEKALAR